MKEFLEYQKEISNLQYTINLLLWELKITAPKDSQSDLVDLIAHFQRMVFELQTNNHYGELLNEIISCDEFNDLKEPEKRYIKNLLRHYEEYKKVPVDFYEEYNKIINESNIAWREAKESNNYDLFKPHLKRVIEITKQYYSYIDSKNSNLYDVMLNKYEIGTKSENLDKLFDELKEEILPLIPENNVETTKLNYNYTKQELIECAKFLLDYIGFDLKKGIIDIYPHGFTEKMNPNDIRITFRETTDPIDFVTTVIHEGGHGIFEQNISPNLSKYENTVIDNLYALHESQSRFYENILGRNKNFWIPIYDKLKQMLHLQIDIDEFIKLLNTPQCSIERVSADELTYCMHIIMRYEIEKMIFNEQLDISQLPKIWNQKTLEYLKVEVKNDAEGLMQDVHWSEGNFGYFPSYLLGAIYDGILLEIIEKELGNIDDILKDGKIKEITQYLIENIYVNGGAYTSFEIFNKLYGKEITAKPLIKYFKNKYSKN